MIGSIGIKKKRSLFENGSSEIKVIEKSLSVVLEVKIDGGLA